MKWRHISCLQTKKDEIDKRSFLKLSFTNKALDGIYLADILHHKSVKSKIPPYYTDRSVPIISYAYTIPTASKMFNYKHLLHDLNIDDFKSKLPDCRCGSRGSAPGALLPLPPLKLEKIWFVCVKSWFFTRNTPTMFAPPSARRNYFKCALPLTWNPGSAPVIAPVQVPHSYNPTGHAITGDLQIINNCSLRDVFAKRPKYHEPKSINWKHNFKILSVEDYARQWAKREKEDLDTLSEWMKSVRLLIQIRI